MANLENFSWKSFSFPYIVFLIKGNFAWVVLKKPYKIVSLGKDRIEALTFTWVALEAPALRKSVLIYADVSTISIDQICYLWHSMYPGREVEN